MIESGGLIARAVRQQHAIETTTSALASKPLESVAEKGRKIY